MCNLKIIVNTSYLPDDVERYLSRKPKRPRRAARACLLCQARKIKCTGNLPCECCQVRKADCVYNESPPPTGSRVAKASPDKTVTNCPTGGASLKPRHSIPLALSPMVRGQSYSRHLGRTAVPVPVASKPVALGRDVAHGDSYGGLSLPLAELTSSPVTAFSPGPGMAPATRAASTHHDQPTPTLDIISGLDSSDLPELPDRSFVARFFTLMGSYLPYMDRETFERRLNRGPLSMSLLYSMAALVSRVDAVDGDNNRDSRDSSRTRKRTAGGYRKSSSGGASAEGVANGALYTKVSKGLVFPYISTPRLDVVYSLVLIAYNEFAEARDAALWTWSGMAIRMCYDLGLHIPEHAKAYDRVLYRNVFGSVVCLDRIVSLSTGRKTSIPDQDLASLTWLDGSDHKVLRTPLPLVEYHRPIHHLCRLMTIAGRISNFINSSPDQDHFAHEPNAMAEYLDVLTEFHIQLPTELYFDIGNFQEARKRKQSQAFLIIHIWHQALLIIVHCPLWSPNYSFNNPISAPQRQWDLFPSQCDTASRCVSNIGDMISLAELIDPNSYLASPLIAQPLYLAACTAINLSELQTNTPYREYSIKNAYAICRSALARMQNIWCGISSHLKSLDRLYSASSAAKNDIVAVQANNIPYSTQLDQPVTNAATLATTTAGGASGMDTCTAAEYDPNTPSIVSPFSLSSASFTNHIKTDSFLPYCEILDSSSATGNEWESEIFLQEITDWATTANAVNL